MATLHVADQPAIVRAAGPHARVGVSFLVSRTVRPEEDSVMTQSWFPRLRRSSAHKQARRTRRSSRPRPSSVPQLVERLEDRRLLSGYQQINLVGYQPGMAHFTDPNLNGWGMTSLPDGSFVVANTFTTGLATFYDRSGHVLPQTITVPASASQPFGPVGHPTGVVYNPTSDFVISENGKSAPARLIFDTLDGTISGWNPAVDPTHAIVMVDNSTGAPATVYTGLEIAQNSQGQNVLYAADFPSNTRGHVRWQLQCHRLLHRSDRGSQYPSFERLVGASRERQALRHLRQSHATRTAAWWTCSIPTATC